MKIFRSLAFCFLLLIYNSATAEIKYSARENIIQFFSSDSTQFLSIDTSVNFIELLRVKQSLDLKLGSVKAGKEKILYRSGEISISEIIPSINGIRISGSIDNTFHFNLLIEEDNAAVINVSIKISGDTAFNRIQLHFLSDSKEQIFGGGEQFSHFNLKHHKVSLFVEENGIGRGDRGISFITNFVNADGNVYTTYAPIPFFITSKNRAFFLISEGIAEFDFTQDNKITIGVNDSELNFLIWQENSPLNILEKYSKVSGRMPSLPEWVYKGSVLGLQGGKAKIERILGETQKEGNTVSAIWIQDWVGKKPTKLGSRLTWNWEANEKEYPDFSNWCDSMKNNGIRILGYINPYLLKDSSLFKVAAANKYLVKNADGSDYVFAAGGFDAAMIDLFNPDARKWYKSVIQQNMVNQGLSGWMADFGEWYPIKKASENEFFGNGMHNRYATEWIALNREVVDENPEKKLFFFNRSGYSYVNRYSTSFWLGDQMTGFGKNDGLPSAICGLISGSVSGIGINHWDIGGYTSFKKGPFKFLRNEELMKRWIEISPFIPIFRTHEGLAPDRNIQFYSSEDMQQFFTRFSKIHEGLYDYFKELLMLSESKGYPVNRPLFLNFPDDENTFDLQTQFMLGDRYLIAPVLNEKDEDVRVYFPKGKWKHYFREEVVEGPVWKEINAPIGTPAVFEMLR